MKKFLFILFLALSLHAQAQTVVSRMHGIKQTLIEWSVIGKDTMYYVPVIDYNNGLAEKIILSFVGKDNLLFTLQYLSEVKLEPGVTVRLDRAYEKNNVSMDNRIIGSGFRVYNVNGFLPYSVFWLRKFIRDDYKRCLKHFGLKYIPNEKKRKSDDDLYY